VSVSSALRKLRLRRLTPADIKNFYRRIDNEGSERGSAILAAALVDATLERVIRRRLPRSDKVFSALFDGEGMISTLDAKINYGICP
jgi:hypothetical protein